MNPRPCTWPDGGCGEPAWMHTDDHTVLAHQLHDERCRTWGCPGTPHTLDWLLARRLLAGEGDG
jgi:hypothetical protein